MCRLGRQFIDTPHKFRRPHHANHRWLDRASMDGNPAVEQWRAIAGFFDTPVGGAIGTALEELLRRTTGVDLSFVRAAAA